MGSSCNATTFPSATPKISKTKSFRCSSARLETAREILQLYAAVIDTLEANVEHLQERAISGFTTVTELADTLVRECGLPFRQAHSVVSALVEQAQHKKMKPDELTLAMLNQVATERIGIRLTLGDEAFRRALDPRSFVERRVLPGGAAPSATAAVLRAQGESIDDDSHWLEIARASLSAADQELQDAVRRLQAS